MRSPYLTIGMERVLREMRDQDEELVYEPGGGGWWVGLKKTSGQVGNALLRLCLIHREEYEGGRLERYSLNEDAKRVLEDSDYVPLIVQVARKNPKLRQALILSGVKLNRGR